MNELPDSDYQILVDLQQGRGEVDVALDISSIMKKSSVAIDNAMDTIRAMAHKVASTMKDVPVVERPHHVEIEFGLKLASDATAMVVSTGLEAQINVKLAWSRPIDKDS